MTGLAARAAARQDRVRRRRRGLGWGLVGLVGELLLTAGVLLLLFVAWQVWWTDVESARVAGATTKVLEKEFGDIKGGPATTGIPDAKAAGGLIEGQAFGLLHIPRFGTDWVQPLLEGTDAEKLKTGLGHYNDTAVPGAVGNFALAGHRTTWGRPLHEIDTLVEGDSIVVETRTGWDLYAVSSHEIVSPTAVEVIAPVPGEPGASPTEALLTLTACHPKYSAEQRYVVHAKLVRTYTREEGLPAAVLTQPAAPALPSPTASATTTATPTAGG